MPRLPRFLVPVLLPLGALVSLHAADSAGWKQAGWGGGGFYWATAYHPTRDGVIYLGGDCAGVYKTEDRGQHWRLINKGISSYAVYSLAVSPAEPETVFAATEEGLCRSRDGGETWQPLPRTGPKELHLTAERDKSVRAVAVDSKNGKNVYAASPGGKVYRSVDGGDTWTVSYERKEEAGGASGLRVQFGKINGEYFGDFVVPVTFPKDLKPAEVSGLGFSLQGENSSLPKDSFLVLKTASGVAYRSRNLREVYQGNTWKDVVLRAEDFIPDPDYAKQHPEAFQSAPSPVWDSVVRLDLACSGNLPAEATTARFGRFFFAAGPAREPQPRLVAFRDLGKEPPTQKFGNLHFGAPQAGTVYSVAVSPLNSADVVAATHDSGLVLSRDAGRTWTVLDTPKKAAHATFDPGRPGVIYGAFFADGIWRSEDFGKTWAALSQAATGKTQMREIVVSPANPLDLFALGYLEWNGAFFASHDGGKTWKNSSTVAVDAAANPTLDSVFNGTAQLSAPRNLTLNPRNPKELFIAGNWRCCLSTDAGQTWKEADRGTDISCITDIRFSKGKTYVTAMDEGTLVSENGGDTWRQLWPLAHTPGLSGHNWRVAVTEVNGAERILSTVSPWYQVPTCVVRSDDGGKTFQVAKAGLPAKEIHANTMWGQGHPRALAVDPKDPQTVYLGVDGDPSDGHNGGGIFRSRDGGTTWTQLPKQPGSRRMFYGLAVDPTDSKRIFWGGSGQGGGIYRSEDGGESWKHIFPNENFVWNVHVGAGGEVYGMGQQLWRSTDHGTTWKQLTQFKEQRSIVGFEVHPREPGTLWVSATTWDSSSKGAVYKSKDGGATWSDITGNLPFVKPQVLRFNSATNELWAGYVGLYKIKQ